jgi:hypothetical protein
MIYDPLKEGKQDSGPKPAGDTIAKEVIVVIIRDIITGTVQFFHQQRLLDAFNKGPVVVGKKASENHVILHDMCLYDYEGKKINSASQIYMC